MVTFTDRAREMVRAFMGEGELEALRIGIEGSPVAPRFELTLVNRTDRRDDEREVEVGDFAVLVPSAAMDQLEGATVDFVERVNESGFEVRPPLVWGALQSRASPADRSPSECATCWTLRSILPSPPMEARSTWWTSRTLRYTSR